MVKAKLLVVDAESNESVHSMLAEQGYQVHLARTPEDTVLSILEGEPEVVIWSEGLDHLTEWQRVKTVLESRKTILVFVHQVVNQHEAHVSGERCSIVTG